MKENAYCNITIQNVMPYFCTVWKYQQLHQAKRESSAEDRCYSCQRKLNAFEDVRTSSEKFYTSEGLTFRKKIYLCDFSSGYDSYDRMCEFVVNSADICNVIAKDEGWLRTDERSEY